MASIRARPAPPAIRASPIAASMSKRWTPPSPPRRAPTTFISSNASIAIPKAYPRNAPPPPARIPCSSGTALVAQAFRPEAFHWPFADQPALRRRFLRLNGSSIAQPILGKASTLSPICSAHPPKNVSSIAISCTTPFSSACSAAGSAFLGGGILKLPCEGWPVTCRTQPLQNLHEIGVRTDEHARAAMLHGAQYLGRRHVRIRSRDAMEAVQALLTQSLARVLPQACLIRNRSPHEARMHGRHKNVRAGQFVLQRLRKSPHRKLARAVRALPDRAHKSQQTGSVHDVGPPLFLKQRKKKMYAVNHAPEIHVHQPAEILQRKLLEISQQCHACIVEHHRHPPVLCRHFFRECLHAGRVSHVYAMLRYLSARVAQQCDRICQPFLVHIR